MLVLSRKIGEAIQIDGDIVVRVAGIQGTRVKLSVEAPRHKRIERREEGFELTFDLKDKR